MTTRKAPFRGRGTALRVKVVRLPHAEGLPLPAYQSTGSAGRICPLVQVALIAFMASLAFRFIVPDLGPNRAPGRPAA